MVDEAILLFRRVARKAGVMNTELFERFMILRFPKEKDECYIDEWARRFLSGNPVCHMDKESKKAYKKAMETY